MKSTVFLLILVIVSHQQFLTRTFHFGIFHGLRRGLLNNSSCSSNSMLYIHLHIAHHLYLHPESQFQTSSSLLTASSPSIQRKYARKLSNIWSVTFLCIMTYVNV